nr:hypothetical protein [Tanacetum cinerariifolium]
MRFRSKYIDERIIVNGRNGGTGLSARGGFRYSLTLVEIKSLVLYWWGVHKEFQERDLVRGLSLSVQASKN